MNKFIYKVVKWVEDPESVSQEERGKNKEYAWYAASAAYSAASAAAAAASDTYAAASAAAVAAVAADAAASAANNNPDSATNWVNDYLKITGESKQDYLDAIEVEKVGSKKEATEEWVDGLPHVGCECLTLHKGDLVECLYVGKGIGEEYIYQVISGCHRGEIDRLIGSPRFRPLKTQEEKEREAFKQAVIDAIHKDQGTYFDRLDKVANILFNNRFKAPEAEK